MLHKSPCLVTKPSKKIKTLITSNMTENISISKELDKQKKIGTHGSVPHLNTSFEYVWSNKIEKHTSCFMLQFSPYK